MENKEDKNSSAKDVIINIGQGLIAGMAGTATLMTSKFIERKITNDNIDTAMAEGVSKLFNVQFENNEKVSQEIQSIYGTLWGVPRALLYRCGINAVPATLLHFGIIYANVLLMEPALNIAPPLKTWSKKKLVITAVHHLVYAAVTGFTFDALNKRSLAKKHNN